jgi:serine/threonine protein kinase
LGEGLFGKVQKAFHINSKQYYALKIIDIKSEIYKKIADVEESNLMKLKGNSPYLVNLIECFEEVCFVVKIFEYIQLSFKNNLKYFVMELCEKSDLHTFIKNLKETDVPFQEDVSL